MDVCAVMMHVESALPFRESPYYYTEYYIIAVIIKGLTLNTKTLLQPMEDLFDCMYMHMHLLFCKVHTMNVM